MAWPDASIEHQTLFRTAEATSRALAAMGWVERDYVPLGQLVPGMAYLVRRVLENSSQASFLIQSRVQAQPEALLAAPAEPEPEPATPEAPALVFQHHPPAQLFREQPREAFQQALTKTRALWGRRYPLRVGGEVFDGLPTASVSPSDPDVGQPVAVVDFADSALTAQAIEAAETGFQRWSALPLAARASVLARAAQLMASERDELAAWIVHEAGRDWQGALADVDEAIDYLRFYSRHALERIDEIESAWEPRGIVAAIPPWNFPLAIPCGMVSAALVTGNAVISKPAEETPLLGIKLIELLHRAGVPPEAAICLPGSGEVVGTAVVTSDAVDLVTFTGSRSVGVSIYRAVAGVRTRRGRLKRAITEMGGKNAILVFPDADLDEAVQAITLSAFGHSNQKCSACSRVLIHHQIYARLSRRLVEAARSLPYGPADDPGVVLNPLISSEARSRVREMATAVRHESRVLLDLMDQDVAGLNLRPLIVEVDARDSSTALAGQEEIFGPVLALTAFETESEAIAIANSTVYGLTAGVFTRSPSTIQSMVGMLQAGNIMSIEA